jgi:hypothetical protein
LYQWWKKCIIAWGEYYESGCVWVESRKFLAVPCASFCTSSSISFFSWTVIQDCLGDMFCFVYSTCSHLL